MDWFILHNAGWQNSLWYLPTQSSSTRDKSAVALHCFLGRPHYMAGSCPEWAKWVSQVGVPPYIAEDLGTLVHPNAPIPLHQGLPPHGGYSFYSANWLHNLKFTINPQFPWVKFRYQSPTRNGVIPAPVDFNCLTLIQQIQTSSLAVDVQWLPWLHEGQGVEPRDGSCYVLVPVSFLLSFIQTNDYWQPMYIYVIYWSFSIANPWFSSSISCDISTVFSTEYLKWIITRSVIWKWHLHSMSQYFQERNVVEYSRPWRICAITKITY